MAASSILDDVRAANSFVSISLWRINNLKRPETRYMTLHYQCKGLVSRRDLFLEPFKKWLLEIIADFSSFACLYEQRM